MKTHLVIGLGEVGSAIYDALEQGPGQRMMRGVDLRATPRGHQQLQDFDFIHVCIPWSEHFMKAVEQWKDRLTPNGIIVVHSTVPLGTTRKLGENAVHSPVRGVHPNLLQGVRTFVKYFGGKMAVQAAKVFDEVGIRTRISSKPEETEALKLLDTTYYGMCIMFEKAVMDYCEEHGLDFHGIYSDANQTYNEGYAKLGRHDVIRPVLAHFPGKIGGHCVIPNAKILGDSFPLAKVLTDFDDKL